MSIMPVSQVFIMQKIKMFLWALSDLQTHNYNFLRFQNASNELKLDKFDIFQNNKKSNIISVSQEFIMPNVRQIQRIYTEKQSKVSILNTNIATNCQIYKFSRFRQQTHTLHPRTGLLMFPHKGISSAWKIHKACKSPSQSQVDYG